MENSLQNGLFNLKDKDVKVLCNKQVFERGLGYFRQGRVSNTQVHGLTLRGEVEGSETRNYKVKIGYEKEGGLIPKCTCPFDIEQFCKHSIALLLHWIHKREEFLDVYLVLKDLRSKSKEELLRLIEEGIKVNPSIIIYLSDPSIKRFKKQLEALFSNYVGYYDVHELIEKLEEVRDGTERLFDRKNVQESFSRLKQIIDLCVRNYGNVDEESLKLYARIIQALNVEWSVKQKIHEDNWKMFVLDEYGLSDYLPSMIMHSCTAENDFILIEKLAQKHAQRSDVESLSLYINAFKDRSEVELLGKIKHLSEELGSWKDVKDELTSFLEQKEDSHNLIEIYLKERDVVSAFKIASLYITNTHDAERVAKACEKSIPF